MKKICWLLLCWPLLVQSQTINVRLFDGIDTLSNPLWNNWHPKLGIPDTTAPLLPGLVSHGGQLVVAIANKATYDYLNGFTLVGAPRHPPIQARITIDSVLLHYPHSVAKMRPDSSTGPITARQWLQQSGPSPAIFTPSDSTGMWVSGLVPGTYVFKLMVQDMAGDLDSATVSATVVPLSCPVCPPPVICPICPPPIICPVCPPRRNAIGVTYTLAGGSWQLKFTYDDGNP